MDIEVLRKKAQDLLAITILISEEEEDMLARLIPDMGEYQLRKLIRTLEAHNEKFKDYLAQSFQEDSHHDFYNKLESIIKNGFKKMRVTSEEVDADKAEKQLSHNLKNL